LHELRAAVGGGLKGETVGAGEEEGDAASPGKDLGCVLLGVLAWEKEEEVEKRTLIGASIFFPLANSTRIFCPGESGPSGVMDVKKVQ
jgi:hypothetical protein